MTSDTRRHTDDSRAAEPDQAANTDDMRAARGCLLGLAVTIPAWPALIIGLISVLT